MVSGERDFRLRLPTRWPQWARSAILHALSLARVALLAATDRVADSVRLEHEVSLLREELRIKDARMERVPPHRRPHNPVTEGSPHPVVAPESHRVGRPDHRADARRLLDLVAARVGPPALALLLLGRRQRRPLLSPDHGRPSLPGPAHRRGDERLPGQHDPGGGAGAPAPDHGPREAVHGAGVPAWLPSRWDPATLRRDRRRGPQRGRLRTTAGRSSSALRAPAAMAARRSLCSATGPGPRAAWRAARTRGPVPGRASAPSRRLADPRGVRAAGIRESVQAEVAVCARAAQHAARRALPVAMLTLGPISPR